MAVVKDQYKEIEDNFGIIVLKIHHQFYSKYKKTHDKKRYLFDSTVNSILHHENLQLLPALPP